MARSEFDARWGEGAPTGVEGYVASARETAVAQAQLDAAEGVGTIRWATIGGSGGVHHSESHDAALAMSTYSGDPVLVNIDRLINHGFYHKDLDKGER